MVELTARTPADGLLPIRVEPFHLIELDPGPMTVLAPFRGQGGPLGKALETAHGVKLPAVNRTSHKGDARLIWFGREQYMLTGVAADTALSDYAAITDQSDAWCAVELQGPGAEEVLARLMPVDLRASVFKRGHTVRSDLKHMMASVTRTGADRLMVMVFRSMAATLVHDLKTAMEAVAARR